MTEFNIALLPHNLIGPIFCNGIDTAKGGIFIVRAFNVDGVRSEEGGEEECVLGCPGEAVEVDCL